MSSFLVSLRAASTFFMSAADILEASATTRFSGMALKTMPEFVHLTPPFPLASDDAEALGRALAGMPAFNGCRPVLSGESEAVGDVVLLKLCGLEPAISQIETHLKSCDLRTPPFNLKGPWDLPFVRVSDGGADCPEHVAGLTPTFVGTEPVIRLPGVALLRRDADGEFRPLSVPEAAGV